jgi:uncharacterized protein
VREQLRRDLVAAIKTRDRVAMSALRSASSALENAAAAAVELAPRARMLSKYVAATDSLNLSAPACAR